MRRKVVTIRAATLSCIAIAVLIEVLGGDRLTGLIAGSVVAGLVLVYFRP